MTQNIILARSRLLTLAASKQVLVAPKSLINLQPTLRFRSCLTIPTCRSILRTQTRYSSSNSQSEDWKLWNFDQVKELVGSDKPNITIIDVREPHEYAEGHIPHAENMPITTSPDALFLPKEDFEERFGFTKPKFDSQVLFYCKAGVRSKASASLAKQAGFQNVNEYRGSYLDWTKNGGQSE